MNVKALLPSALALLFLSCANSPSGPELAGSGSESPNALRGTVLIAEAGKDIPQPGAEVLLYAVTETHTDSGIDYAWALSDSTLADAQANFFLDSIEPGSYTLIFQKGDRKTFSGYFNIEASDDTVTCFAFLEPTQTICGTIRDTADTASKEFYLGLVGTPYFDTVTTADSFAFANIPAGKYKWDIRSEVIKPPIANSVLFADSTIFVTMAGTASFTIAWDSVSVLADTVSAPYLDEADAVPVFPWYGWTVNLTTLNIEPVEKKIQMTEETFIIEYTVTENP